MANIRKWIAEARDLEDSGDLQGALAIYRKALVAQEETSGFADLSLYNGLGDLFLRAGHTAEAIEAYLNAAAQCEEQQLYANGIALCKKVLRNAPDHIPVFRRVGRLFALSGLDAEATANYREYARRVRESGQEDAALSALREMIELTADEVAAVDLADTLVSQHRVHDALAMLRSARERRERQGRDFVLLLRKIQEVQSLATPETGVAQATEDEGDTTARAPAHPIESAAKPRSEAPQRGETGRDDAREPATPRPSVEPSISFDTADLDSLTQELQRVLLECEGNDRFRHALPIIDHLLEIQPGRFDLIHRKLAYAFALGEEAAAIAAYLALGESLHKELRSFTLRTLSTSTPSGAVTAAVKVEASELAPGS
ncbi:MAG: hypothetical protein OEU54_11165 [Gemmatimonadota bacterium]|nr:hypothetical protein [Gemmatimonadota bacterium]